MRSVPRQPCSVVCCATQATTGSSRGKTASRRGLSMRQLRRARERGELAIYLIGGWPRVRWVDVVAWIESRRQTVLATVVARRPRP